MSEDAAANSAAGFFLFKSFLTINTKNKNKETLFFILKELNVTLYNSFYFFHFIKVRKFFFN